MVRLERAWNASYEIVEASGSTHMASAWHPTTLNVSEFQYARTMNCTTRKGGIFS